MRLGIFQPPNPIPAPAWANEELWGVAAWHARIRYDGPTEGEPWVAQTRSHIIARLTRMHHGDPALAEAHRQRDEALLAYQSAARDERQVADETAARIQASRIVRDRRGDPTASHLRSEGARAQEERRQARELRAALQRPAEGQELALRRVSVEVTNRMMEEATAGVARMNEYVSLLNVLRMGDGLPALPPVPDGLAEQLVLEAGRDVGEPPHR